MKKQLLATLVTAAACAPAFAEPTVYGKANVSFQLADENDVSTTELTSNASRIGVKGDLDVEGGLEVIYQAEFEVQFDDGDSDGETFSQRNIFIGVKGDFGAVKAGKFDTPLKVAQNKVDLFNDLEGDIKNMITVNDNRADNIVSYESPNLAGFQGKFAVVSSELENQDDGFSASGSYTIEGLYLALALDQDVEAEGVDAVRFVAQYSFADIQLGAMYENLDPDQGNDADALFFSAKYTLNDFAFKGQLGLSDIVEEDGRSVSLGVDYRIAKPLKVFAYYTMIDSDDVTENAGQGTDNQYLGAGVELKF